MTAVGDFGTISLKWDPKNLEIRTMSVEKTLEPLVLQVTTLVNTKGPSKKKKGMPIAVNLLIISLRKRISPFASLKSTGMCFFIHSYCVLCIVECAANCVSISHRSVCGICMYWLAHDLLVFSTVSVCVSFSMKSVIWSCFALLRAVTLIHWRKQKTTKWRDFHFVNFSPPQFNDVYDSVYVSQESLSAPVHWYWLWRRPRTVSLNAANKSPMRIPI